MRWPEPLRAACLTLLLLGLGSLPAGACMAGFYPEATLVTDSPLIFVGRVESVEKLEKKPWGYDEGDPWPSIATVHVVRFIHGTYSEPVIRVRSGPLVS